MSEHTEKSSKNLSRLQRTAAGMAGLMVLYAVVDFLVTPPINISLKNFSTQREHHGLQRFTASLAKDRDIENPINVMEGRK